METETADTPRNLYFQTVGYTPEGEGVDLKIENISEYRAWRYIRNGVKREEVGDVVGYFGVINLLGPRALGQPGIPETQWNDQFTYVDLRYTFVGRDSGQPINLQRTYVSFYDLDTGVQYFDPGSNDFDASLFSQTEALQFAAGEGYEDQGISSYRTPDTQLVEHTSWKDFLAHSPSSYEYFLSTSPDLTWPSTLFAASQYGIGDDNPISPFTLSKLQAQRSVMLEVRNASSFRVRFAISVCCTTGRNFLFAGYSELLVPLCPLPPSPPPPESPPAPPPPCPVEDSCVVPSTGIPLVGAPCVPYYSYSGSLAVGCSIGPVTTDGTTQTLSYSLTGADPSCAPPFVPYYSYGGSLAVSGMVSPVITEGTTQVFSYAITGADPACASGSDPAIPNSCGVHIHAGTSCSADALGHYYTGAVTTDPWTDVYYTVDGLGTASATVSVDTGSSASVMGRRVLIFHAYDGSRIACTLVGTDPSIPNSCGVHIHAGLSCAANALGHYYTGDVTTDPWTNAYCE